MNKGTTLGFRVDRNRKGFYFGSGAEGPVHGLGSGG